MKKKESSKKTEVAQECQQCDELAQMCYEIQRADFIRGIQCGVVALAIAFIVICWVLGEVTGYSLAVISAP
jgi:hypothetical protein|tara:strand:+ start:1707 stop:1919 length:213 start_codon:yes stop_codon:yes gene_type:complete